MKELKRLEQEIDDYEEMIDAMLQDGFNREYAERIIEESYKLGLLDAPMWM